MNPAHVRGPAQVPPGARPSARVLLIWEERILLLEAQDPPGQRRWWVAPGGGLRDGETFADAAVRELVEETGQTVPIGPWVWTRHHVYPWDGRTVDQYERYFVARTSSADVDPREADSYIVGHRWWSLEEIQASSEDFAPRRLGQLLPPLLRAEYPASPIDCGI